MSNTAQSTVDASVTGQCVKLTLTYAPDTTQFGAPEELMQFWYRVRTIIGTGNDTMTLSGPRESKIVAGIAMAQACAHKLDEFKGKRLTTAMIVEIVKAVGYGMAGYDEFDVDTAKAMDDLLGWLHPRAGWTFRAEAL